VKQPRYKIASLIADNTLKNGVERNYSKEIAAYLLSEKRTTELDSILRDIQTDWANEGYVEAICYSAFKLNEANIAEIKQKLKAYYQDAKQIIITEVHDPSVIGGVVIKLADKQLDLSIETKLNKFKYLTTIGKD
jgi:F-type H+-transporting ATPase subunit delta